MSLLLKRKCCCHVPALNCSGWMPTASFAPVSIDVTIADLESQAMTQEVVQDCTHSTLGVRHRTYVTNSSAAFSLTATLNRHNDPHGACLTDSGGELCFWVSRHRVSDLFPSMQIWRQIDNGSLEAVDTSSLAECAVITVWVTQRRDADGNSETGHRHELWVYLCIGDWSGSLDFRAPTTVGAAIQPLPFPSDTAFPPSTTVCGQNGAWYAIPLVAAQGMGGVDGGGIWNGIDVPHTRTTDATHTSNIAPASNAILIGTHEIEIIPGLFGYYGRVTVTGRTGVQLAPQCMFHSTEDHANLTAWLEAVALNCSTPDPTTVNTWDGMMYLEELPAPDGTATYTSPAGVTDAYGHLVRAQVILDPSGGQSTLQIEYLNPLTGGRHTTIWIGFGGFGAANGRGNTSSACGRFGRITGCASFTNWIQITI